MTIAAISRFLRSVTIVGRGVFDVCLTQTDWQILTVLGGACDPVDAVVASSTEMVSPMAQSYKTIKCGSGLSDDALSRGLRRLLEMGLVARHSTEADLRVIRYSLTPRAEEGLAQIGRILVSEMGSLVLSLVTKPQPTAPLEKVSGGE